MVDIKLGIVTTEDEILWAEKCLKIENASPKILIVTSPEIKIDKDLVFKQTCVKLGNTLRKSTEAKKEIKLKHNDKLIINWTVQSHSNHKILANDPKVWDLIWERLHNYVLPLKTFKINGEYVDVN